MEFPVVANNLILSAIAIGLLGIVECFFGYRIFRLVLAVLGFVIGAGLAISLANSDQTAVILIVGLVGGVIGAIVFYFLYFVGTFLAGITLGSTIAAVLAANLNLASEATTVLIIVGAILGGFLGAILAKYIIMLSTAFGGATQIVYAGLVLLANMGSGLRVNQIQITLKQPDTLIATVIILLLAAFGFIVQFTTNRPPVSVRPSDVAV